MAERTPPQCTLDAFPRAETLAMMAGFVDRLACENKLVHNRAIQGPNAQTVVRMNQDVLYSTAVLDLGNAQSFRVAFPPNPARYASMQVINEHHENVLVAYGGAHTISIDTVKSRFCIVLLRVAADSRDLADARLVQDQFALTSDPPLDALPSFDLPTYDPETTNTVRTLLRQLKHHFAWTPEERTGQQPHDRLAKLISAAGGWGGLPPRDAYYTIEYPSEGDGTYVLTVPQDVPMERDGFWSLTVYDSEGYLRADATLPSSVNNRTAVAEADGTVVVAFVAPGERADEFRNVLEQAGAGWSYTVRVYRPLDAILDGTWRFPVAKKV